jgi:uncharacterized protein
LVEGSIVSESPIETVLWHNPYDRSSELCRLLETPGGFALVGIALAPADSSPARVEYRVDTDAQWRTQKLVIEVAGPGTRELSLVHDESGEWLLDGEPQDRLAGCVDVDFRLTPSTNMLPICRLAPSVGESADTRAAWVGWPNLEVVVSDQTYERLGDNEYRFRSGDFESDLLVDDTGLVLKYGDEYWRALAHGSRAVEPS